MPTTVQTTAAMNPPAEPPPPAATAATADASGEVPQRGARRAGSVAVPPNSILGGLAVALVTAMFSMLMWQINSLGNRIDAQGARIGALETGLRAEMGTLETGLRNEIGTLGTELRAEMGTLGTELRNEMGTLGTELRNEMGALGTELRNEMGALETGLRAEMQAGFREINAILLDHTDRLARLEAAVGLPRGAEALAGC